MNRIKKIVNSNLSTDKKLITHMLKTEICKFRGFTVITQVQRYKQNKWKNTAEISIPPWKRKLVALRVTAIIGITLIIIWAGAATAARTLLGLLRFA